MYWFWDRLIFYNYLTLQIDFLVQPWPREPRGVRLRLSFVPGVFNLSPGSVYIDSEHGTTSWGCAAFLASINVW